MLMFWCNSERNGSVEALPGWARCDTWMGPQLCTDHILKVAVWQSRSSTSIDITRIIPLQRRPTQRRRIPDTLIDNLKTLRLEYPAPCSTGCRPYEPESEGFG
ncbi:hypothetical protein IG631_10327 [Alternaria alternata]|nr:hypothetical protein IG631_10327 [Alternaria alternata]